MFVPKLSSTPIDPGKIFVDIDLKKSSFVPKRNALELPWTSDSTEDVGVTVGLGPNELNVLNIVLVMETKEMELSST